MKGRTIQDSLHLVLTIVEKVDGNAVLINLHQSKALIDCLVCGQFWAALSHLDPSS